MGKDQPAYGKTGLMAGQRRYAAQFPAAFRRAPRRGLTPMALLVWTSVDRLLPSAVKIAATVETRRR